MFKLVCYEFLLLCRMGNRRYGVGALTTRVLHFLPAQPTQPSASGSDIAGCDLVVAVNGMAAHLLG